MIVESNSGDVCDDEEENVTGRNTDSVQTIRSLSDCQLEKFLGQIQPKRPRNSARANIGGKQVLVPTGNADSQLNDKMPALPRGYKHAPEMKADENTWRSVFIAPKLWLRDPEDAIADIGTSPFELHPCSITGCGVEPHQDTTMAFVIASHEGCVFLRFATCGRETSAVRCAADGQYTKVPT